MKRGELPVCDKESGQCKCRRGMVGRQCNEVQKLHYLPTLHQVIAYQFNCLRNLEYRVQISRLYAFSAAVPIRGRGRLPDRRRRGRPDRSQRSRISRVLLEGVRYILAAPGRSSFGHSRHISICLQCHLTVGFNIPRLFEQTPLVLLKVE